jgi:hypothetical protein
MPSISSEARELLDQAEQARESANKLVDRNARDVMLQLAQFYLRQAGGCPGRYPGEDQDAPGGKMTFLSSLLGNCWRPSSFAVSSIAQQPAVAAGSPSSGGRDRGGKF